MEQITASKVGKEYDKPVYCHSAYLTYMQSTSYKMPGWMNYMLELRLPGEIQPQIRRFRFLGSKITADGDCNHKIKRRLLLGRKTMTNLKSVLKAESSLCQLVRLVKAIVFPVVMYRCERRTVKKAEH